LERGEGEKRGREGRGEERIGKRKMFVIACKVGRERGEKEETKKITSTCEISKISWSRRKFVYKAHGLAPQLFRWLRLLFVTVVYVLGPKYGRSSAMRTPPDNF
jgi:hypothetical protein